MLNDCHAAAAASNDPGPGPVESNAECTSGGDAIQIGAVIAAENAGAATSCGKGNSTGSTASPFESRAHGP
ncbi:hypothetical protein MINS_18820 [Mycolicibacterium insubricum]|nr:hypothetical protein MINS_18820 [Mycolicibacterium insubricum]